MRNLISVTATNAKFDFCDRLDKLWQSGTNMCGMGVAQTFFRLCDKVWQTKSGANGMEREVSGCVCMCVSGGVGGGVNVENEIILHAEQCLVF
jgi:hypothetical protein